MQCPESFFKSGKCKWDVGEKTRKAGVGLGRSRGLVAASKPSRWVFHELAQILSVISYYSSTILDTFGKID